MEQYHEVSIFADRIEAQLQRMRGPLEERSHEEEAHGLEQYLQCVVRRMRQTIAERGAFPDASNLGMIAAREYHMGSAEEQRLIGILGELDEFIENLATYKPRLVRCACDAAFSLPLLDYDPTGGMAASCTRCGYTDLAIPILLERWQQKPAFQGYRYCNLSEPVRAWVIRWPPFQASGVRGIKSYLSCTARFESTTELVGAIDEAGSAQSGKRLSEVLRGAGVPGEPPPEGMPRELDFFTGVWRALQCGEATPVEQVLALGVHYGESSSVVQILGEGAKLGDLVGRALAKGNPVAQRFGLRLIGQFPAEDAVVVGEIQVFLRDLGPHDHVELLATLRATESFGAQVKAELRTGLVQAQMRLADVHYIEKTADALSDWERR